MKLYIKANSLEILKNIDTLLSNANAKAEYLLNHDSNLEYKLNIESAKRLETQKEKLFYSNKPLKQLTKGIYFGNSHCEHLLSHIKDVVEAFEFCKKRHYNFVFVFPPISLQMIDDAKRILTFLTDNQALSEVVVNDTGVLELATQTKGIKPIIGLNFTKTIKNSFVDVVEQTDIDKKIFNNQQNLLKNIEFEIKEVREFYKELGIGRFSLDKSDINLSFLDDTPRFYVDIYYPYMTLSNSKACDIAGMFDDKRGYFAFDDCPKYCNFSALEFKDNDTLKLYQRYNTIVKPNIELNIEKIIYKNSKNRLIWEIFL